MLKGIAFLVITGLLWVIIGVILSKAAKKQWNLSKIQGEAAIFAAVVVFITSFATGNFSPGSIPPEAWCAYFCYVVSGALNFVVFLLMSKAMESGNNSQVWSLSQSSLIFPFMTGVLFFDNSCPVWRWIGVGLILTALLLSGEFTQKSFKFNISRKKLPAWLKYTLAAFFTAGLLQTLNSLPSYWEIGAELNYINRALAIQIGNIIIYGLILLHNRRKSVTATSGNFLATLALSAANLLVLLFFLYKGLDILSAAGSGSIGYPIALGSCIVGFFLYSVLILREKNTKNSFAAFILCLAGIIIVSL